MSKCANYKANSRGRILVLTGLLEVSEWVKIILGGSISWTYIPFWQIIYGFLLTPSICNPTLDFHGKNYNSLKAQMYEL